jgi:hypothetical protein
MNMAETLKGEYNKILIQWNKATQYLEHEATAEQVDKWLPKYEFILKQRNSLCNEIWQETGIKPTVQQFEGGF